MCLCVSVCVPFLSIVSVTLLGFDFPLSVCHNTLRKADTRVVYTVHSQAKRKPEIVQ